MRPMSRVVLGVITSRLLLFALVLPAGCGRAGSDSQIGSQRRADTAPTVEPGATRYTAADAVTINFSGTPGNAHDWVGVFTPDAADTAPAQWKYTNGAVDGAVSFLGIPVGSYEARLFLNDTNTRLATSTQQLTVTPSTATVEPGASSYTTADPVVMTFTGAPGNAHDWVGVFVPGTADTAPVMWKYTGGGASGSVSFLGIPIGSAYEARLFVNDSNVRIATSTGQFTIVPSGATVEPAAGSYTIADSAVIIFTGSPGNAHDWVGVFVPGTADTAPVMWKYTGGAASGSVSFLGIPIGSYEARLFVNDTNVRIATSTQQFTVEGSAAAVAPAAISYTTADTVGIIFTGAPGNPKDWIGIFVPGTPDTSPLAWKYTEGGASGGVSFTGIPVGSFEARLFVNDTNVRIATSTQQFSVSGSTATLTPEAASYTVADAVALDFANAPGNAHDWVGIFVPGTADTTPIQWKYTGGGQAGTVSFVGLAVGSYEGRLFVNDTNVRIATSTGFTVGPSSATVEPTAMSFTTADPAIMTFTGAPGNAKDWVGVFVPGTPDTAPVRWQYTGGGANGSVSFLGIPVGSPYEARLFVNDTNARIATSTQQFAVVAANASVEPSASSYTIADHVIIVFAGAPGNVKDWVGIFAADSPDTAPLQWKYTGGAAAGSLSFLGIPLGSGYGARLFVNDTVVQIAQSSGTFDIGPSTASVWSEQDTFAAGEAVLIDFSGGPGHAKDWIGLYAPAIGTSWPGSPDGAPVTWQYVQGQTAGTLSFTSVPGGVYEARYFVDDSLVKIAWSWVFAVSSAGCVALTCATFGAECDEWPDGCGSWLECGVCPTGRTCGGDGVRGVCGRCWASTCADYGAQCGNWDDGCGGMLDCGDCPWPQTCGWGGTAGVCGGCMPATCQDLNVWCGSADDRCGGTLQCGDCTPPWTCQRFPEGEVQGARCACNPNSCIDLNKNCGTWDDGCGGTVDCGACDDPQTCGGGGVDGVCGPCAPTSCAALGYNCGTWLACGGWLQCGECSGLDVCGGGGQQGVCGCTPNPNACQSWWIDSSWHWRCGLWSDGCGGTVDCGGCWGREWCGGLGFPGLCGGCMPYDCADYGQAACGILPDGCGWTLDCGGCTAPASCGGGGTPNQCGTTCAALGLECGTVDLGGGVPVVTCPQCRAPDRCGGGGVPNMCSACQPRGCTASDCGTTSDGCGKVMLCPCGAPTNCGG